MPHLNEQRNLDVVGLDKLHSPLVQQRAHNCCMVRLNCQDASSRRQVLLFGDQRRSALFAKKVGQPPNPRFAWTNVYVTS